ncbi:hypothetical protein GCM10023328_01280 [Modestobacter marinus]|uniref:Uncharacterized protein n=1 Tax=Modestobacter marinus TaxID=477641 RepID=A0A846LMR9_9ACTN|nr:hypothetical protein [Modestobacter marinus]NIH67442.1 hypothetical protein [Modestobacter marinus]GGL54920.1 hypothetical protein GCM10011589_08680 [Modestobacter marinus]
MLLITCPVTRTDELVADRRIRSVANHPTHIAVAVECPSCGGSHVFRTGRRWEEHRAELASRAATQAATQAPAQETAQDTAPDTSAAAARAARVRQPA